MSDETRTHIRLFVLVILAFLPAMVLYGFANRTLQDVERSRQEDRLVELARLTGMEYRRLVQESRQLLSALAHFPEIREARQPECSRRLAGVLESTPQYTTLSVIGEDGYLSCGSLEADGPLYLGDRAYYLLATTQRRFSVGEYARGRITGKPTVGVAYPMGDGGDGGIQPVLAASLDLTDLGRHAATAQLPPATTLTIVDRAGTVLLRRSDAAGGADTVGARLPDALLADVGTDADPVLRRGTDLDGVERVFAVAPLVLPGDRSPEGWVALGTAESSVLADAEEVARAELRLLALAGLAILLLAWVFGHYGLVRAGRPTPRPAAA